MKKKLLSIIITAVFLLSALTPLSVYAAEISFNQTYSSTLTSLNSAIYYTFSTSSTGDLQITLTSQVNASSDILVMNLYKSSTGEHIYSCNFGYTGALSNGVRTVEVPARAISAGNYTIELTYVNNASKITANVSLNAKFTPASSGGSKNVSLNTETSDSLSSTATSRRYYFTLPSAGSVSVTVMTPVSHTTNAWTLSMYAADNSSNKLCGLTFGAGGVTTSDNRKYAISDKVRLPAGTYYVTVEAADSANLSTNSYSINIGFSEETSSEFEKEPNNTMETANALALNTEICGNISDQSDIDMFRITLSNSGSLKLQFSTSSAIDTDAWSVYLYDSNGVVIQNSTAGFGGNVSGAKRVKMLDKMRLPAGTYYAVVTAKSSTNRSNTDYYLKPVFEAETTNRYEKEFNNTLETANNILLNLSITGNMSSKDDVDYFTFDLTSASEIKIEFQTPETVMQNYWTIFLQDEKGGIATYYAGLVGSTVSGRRVFLTETETLAPGKYYIVIYPINKNVYSNDDYSLMVRCDSAPIPTASEDDSTTNPMNVPTRNSNVNVNLKGALINQEDKNSYAFQIIHHGSVMVNFQYPSSITRNTWMVRIYDENSNLLSEYGIGAGGQSISSIKSESTPGVRLPAGYYKLEVSAVNSYNYSSAQYDFVIMYTDESETEEKYEIEYNNTPGQATPILSGVEYTGNISNDRDADYFKFTMESGSVSLDFSTPESAKRKDWVVRLLDANQSVKYEYEFGAEGTAGKSGFKTESARKVRVPKGTYYVYVGPYNSINYSAANYKLKVTYTAESPYKFEQEPNNSFLTSNSLNLNEYKTGNLDSLDDVDFYKFTLADGEGCQIKFRTNAKVTQGFWFVHLYDSKQTLLKKYRFGDAGSVSLDGMRNALSEVISISAGEYYLAIAPFSDQTISYEDYSVKILDKTGQRMEKIAYLSDKPSSWATDEVELAYGEGLVPDAYLKNFTTPATRLEFCKLVANFLEIYKGKLLNEILKDANVQMDKTAFDDTNEDVIFAITALGIVNGKGNNKFAPDDKITRQEAAAFLHRTAQLLEIKMNVQPLDFKDSSKFASWSKDAIPFVSGCMDGKGDRVMNGVSADTFDYAAMYTREQVYITLLRLYRAGKGK